MANGPKTLRTVGTREWEQANPPRTTEELLDITGGPAGRTTDIGGGIVREDLPGEGYPDFGGQFATAGGESVYTLPGDEGQVTLFRGSGAPGSEVRLENLESFIYTGEGPVPERLQGDPDIVAKIQAGEALDPRAQMHLDDPTLAQREADLELVRRVDPNDPRLSGRTQEEVRAAQARIDATDGYGAAGPPSPITMLSPMEQQRDGFIQFSIDRMFGGQDPRMRNALDEVRGLTEDYWKQIYEQGRRSGTIRGEQAIGWDFLTDAQKQKYIQQAATVEVDVREDEIQNQVAALEGLIGRFDTDLKRAAAERKAGRERYQEEIEGRMEARKSARKAVIAIDKDLSKAQQDLVEEQARFTTPENEAQKQENIRQLKERIKFLQDMRGEQQQIAVRERSGETAVTDVQEEIEQRKVLPATGAEATAQGMPKITNAQAQQIIDDFVAANGRKPTQAEANALALQQGLNPYKEAAAATSPLEPMEVATPTGA